MERVKSLAGQWVSFHQPNSEWQLNCGAAINADLPVTTITQADIRQVAKFLCVAKVDRDRLDTIGLQYLAKRQKDLSGQWLRSQDSWG